MGLFDFLKKEEKASAPQEQKLLIAMPLFGNGDRYELEAVVQELATLWGLHVSEVTGDNDTAILTVNGATVAIAYMPVPVPPLDIEGTAAYAYNWPTAVDDLAGHSGHAIVSVLAGPQPALERFRVLSMVLAAIFTTSGAVGVYQGTQSLLIPKDQYLEHVEELRNGGTPVHLWLYIGLRQTAEGNSIYTHGLSEFGKQEMEVVNSKRSLEELYDFVSNISAYVVDRNVTLKSGETLGYTADDKVHVRSSKGHFVSGDTLKLEL